MNSEARVASVHGILSVNIETYTMSRTMFLNINPKLGVFLQFSNITIIIVQTGLTY